MSGLNLTDEQRAVTANWGGELLVSAAAGSGKTRVLVERLLLRIDAGADIDDFLIITYTNAAAAELRSKILDALYERIAADPMNTRLRREAELAGRAKIETIHSFCLGVIRENAHALGLSPDFRVADDAESRELKEAALGELLEERYDSGDPGFYALADTMGAGNDDKGLAELVLETHGKLLSHPDPAKWVEVQLEALRLSEGTDLAGTAWGQVIVEKARRAAGFWRERMEYLVDEAACDPTLEKGYGRSFRATVASIRAFEAALDGSWDEARAASKIDFPAGRISGYEEEKAVRSACKDAMVEIGGLFWDSSEKAIADMRTVTPAVEALLRLVLAFDERYAALKRRRGVLDFSDQEHMALRLLTDPETGERTPLAEEIARRFTEIMVDEYQDVNEIQERIFAAVSRDGRNVFMVGDVKQSIYRFRLADPTIFIRKYLTFKDGTQAGEGEPRKLLLNRNFRSREGILAAANFVFKNVMSRDFGDLDYTTNEYLYPGAAYPESPEPQVELDVVDLALTEEDEERDDKVTAEALFAARRIRELVATAQVSDGKGGLRSVTYGDVAVLMRSPKSALPRWQAAFAAEGVPLAVQQSSDFFAQEEVSLLLALLTVIDNPRQDIPLITVMRSPIYGFTPDELGNIRVHDREGDFYSALLAAAGTDGKCAAFLASLSAFREAAPDMTSDELLWHVCRETDLFAIVSAMPDGARRRENLLLLFEYARSFESAGYKGLFGFLTHIQRLRGQNAGGERGTGGGENAVKLMSIHKSKGLEFPIVILAGLVHGFNSADERRRLLIHPELGVGPKRTDLDRKLEYPTIARRAISERMRHEMLSEELRVLYVAMTRAQEKLIMLCSYVNAERSLQRLMNAEMPVPPYLLEGARCMADWVLMPALRREESAPIRFGHPNVPCETEGEVWDVRLISNPVASREREAEREESEKPLPPIPERLAERLAFVYPHAPAVSLPSKITATELKGTYRTQEAAEEAAPMEAGPHERPPHAPAFMEGGRGLTAAQRGTAAHIVMQYADYQKCRTAEGAAEEIERLRALGTITKEQAEAVDPRIISRFFASEPGALILNADRLWRELKFSLLVDSGFLTGAQAGEKLLLQGVVDCCVEHGGVLTVIDFKTDYVTEETMDERAEYYRGQLDAYAKAMERILHKPVSRRILCFLTAGRYKVL